MAGKTTEQRANPQRIAGKRETDALPGIPIGSNEGEYEEPGAFGEKVAEKMLAIAKEYFPPVSTENQE